MPNPIEEAEGVAKLGGKIAEWVKGGAKAVSKGAVKLGKLGLESELIKSMLGKDNDKDDSATNTNSNNTSGVTSGNKSSAGSATSPNLAGIYNFVKKIDETPFKSDDTKISTDDMQFRQTVSRKLNEIDKKISRVGNISIAIKQTLDAQMIAMRKTAETLGIQSQENSLKQNQNGSNGSSSDKGLIQQAQKAYSTSMGKVAAAIALLGLGLLAKGGGGGGPDGTVTSSNKTEGAEWQRAEHVTAMGARQFSMFMDRKSALDNKAYTRLEERALAKEGIVASGIWYKKDGKAISKEEIDKELQRMRSGHISTKAFNSAKSGITKVGNIIKDKLQLARIKAFIQEVKPVFKKAETLRKAISPVENYLKRVGVSIGGSLGNIMKIVLLLLQFMDTIEDALAKGVLSEQTFKDFCMNLGQLGAAILTTCFVKPLQKGGMWIGEELGGLIGIAIGAIFPPAEVITTPLGIALGFLATLAIDDIAMFVAQEFGGDFGLFFFDWMSKGSIVSAAEKFVGRIWQAGKTTVKKGITGAIHRVASDLFIPQISSFVGGLFGFGKKNPDVKTTSQPSVAPTGITPSNASIGNQNRGFPAGGTAVSGAAAIYKKLAPTLNFDKKFKELSREDQDKYLTAMAENEGRSKNNINHRNNNPGNILWSSGDRSLLEKYGAKPGTRANGLIYAEFPSWQAGWECAREKLMNGRYANMTLAQDAQLWTGGGGGVITDPNEPKTVSPGSTGSTPVGADGKPLAVHGPVAVKTPGFRRYDTEAVIKDKMSKAGAGSGAGPAGSGAGPAKSGAGPATSDKKFSGTGAVNRKFVGKTNGVDTHTLDLFAKVQGELGLTIPVTSGARPAGWITPRGTKSASNNPHVLRKALDLGVTGDQTKIAEAAIAAGFTGIGGEGNHLHIDNSHSKLTAWGPDYHGSSTPGWLKSVIAKHGGSTSGGSDMASSSDAKASPNTGTSFSSGSGASSGSGSMSSSMGKGSTSSSEMASATMPQKKPTTRPTPKKPNTSTQWGIPDPMYPHNRADEYSVFFNANEPAFGTPMHLV